MESQDGDGEGDYFEFLKHHWPTALVAIFALATVMT